jgi:hypothetical protein
METDDYATAIQPEYRTERPEDVEEILRRAAIYCEANTVGGETVAAELEEAADYVSEEML